MPKNTPRWTRVRRWGIPAGAVLAGVGIGAGAMALWGPEEEQSREGLAADAGGTQTVTVGLQTLEESVSATGTLAAVSSDALAFEASGTVTKVNVEAGDTVEKGDVIALYSPNTIAYPIAFYGATRAGATVTTATPDKAAWRVRPKLAFLSGSLDTTATVTARESDTRVTYEMYAKGIGASSTVQAVMTFAPSTDGGTTVTWTGEIVSLTGLLKLVPGSLIQGAAKKVIADVWADIHKKLAEG